DERLRRPPTTSTRTIRADASPRLASRARRAGNPDGTDCWHRCALPPPPNPPSRKGYVERSRNGTSKRLRGADNILDTLGTLSAAGDWLRSWRWLHSAVTMRSSSSLARGEHGQWREKILRVRAG